MPPLPPTTLARRVTLVAEALEAAGVEVHSLLAEDRAYMREALHSGVVVVHAATAEAVQAAAERLGLDDAEVYGDFRRPLMDVVGVWADIPVKVYGPAAVAEVMAS